MFVFFYSIDADCEIRRHDVHVVVRQIDTCQLTVVSTWTELTTLQMPNACLTNYRRLNVLIAITNKCYVKFHIKLNVFKDSDRHWLIDWLRASSTQTEHTQASKQCQVDRQAGNYAKFLQQQKVFWCFYCEVSLSLPPTKEQVNAFARVCPLARLLKNACMDMDEMLRVDRCRDMDELSNFWARSRL